MGGMKVKKAAQLLGVREDDGEQTIRAAYRRVAAYGFVGVPTRGREFAVRVSFDGEFVAELRSGVVERVALGRR